MAITKPHPIKSTLKAAIDLYLQSRQDGWEASGVLLRLHRGDRRH